MGQDSQGFSFSVFAFKFGKEFFAFGISSEEEAGGFREGPFEMGVTDLFSGGSVAFSCRLLERFDEPAVGGEFLDPRESVDVVNFIEDDEGQDFSDAVHGPKAVVGIDIMFFGVP